MPRVTADLSEAPTLAHSLWRQYVGWDWNCNGTYGGNRRSAPQYFNPLASANSLIARS